MAEAQKGVNIIRETTQADIAQVLALYPLAFPDEDLLPVVSALLAEGPDVLSLATFSGDTLVAHVLFTICGTEHHDRAGALLGPLGVIPSHQRMGLGDNLVRAGLERLQASGTRQVFVLGAPAYYQRFGFATEQQVQTPYPLPEEYIKGGAWQSMPLAERAPMAAGQLSLPTPWMDPELW